MATIQASVQQFAGGVNAYRNPTAHGVADYLYWMCGVFALQAQDILNIQQGGGQVNGSIDNNTIYPFIITAADFEPDGVTYNNPNIVGDRLMIYVNYYNQVWYNDTSGAFIYTGTGIKITLPGFNAFAGFPPFSVVIQLNNS